MRKTIIVLLTLFLAAACVNRGVRRPSKNDLYYSVEFAMTRPLNSAYLLAEVPGFVDYVAPNSGGDCNQGLPRTHRFGFENAEDYVDVTISDGLGIGGDVGDSRSYQLVRNAGVNSQSWFLIMQQSPNPSSFLHTARWRLKLNAVPTNPEIGNGGPLAPPADQAPWERSVNPLLVGGTYHLHVLGGTVGTHITASLVFRLAKHGIPVC
jgi:hypothetical protein